MADIISDRPLTSLFNKLTQDTASLFHQEIRLARAELSDKARQAGRGATEIAIGGVLLLLALGALTAAGILALALVVQPWLAALIVGVAVGLVGVVVLVRGLDNVRTNNLTPRRTMDSLRDNTRWAKEQIR
ncbi:MAG: phage holin family protein [Magnetospirillum sp.]|nr:phage holin family protein [Magnetospirillum sp.]